MHIIENLIINFVYAAFGILMTLAAMYYGTLLLDKMTDFDTSDQINLVIFPLVSYTGVF